MALLLINCFIICFFCPGSRFLFVLTDFIFQSVVVLTQILKDVLIYEILITWVNPQYVIKLKFKKKNLDYCQTCIWNELK